MTSPYLSPTEVVDASARTDHHHNQPMDDAQLTAAAENTENPKPEIGSVANPSVSMQDDGGGKPDDRREESLGSLHGENVPDDKAGEGQFAASATTTLNAVMESMRNGAQDDHHIAHENELNALADAMNTPTANGQSTQEYQPNDNPQPELQNSAQTFAENGDPVDFHNDRTFSMDAGPMMANGQQALDLINGLPMNEADALMSFQMMSMNQFAQQPYLDRSPILDVETTRIQAYAKIEFPDGEFYMNTYSIVLGRDIQAARAAMRRDKEEEKRKIEEPTGPGPHPSVKVKREESRYSKSIVSEPGGILRGYDESDSDRVSRKKKSRKASKRSKSTGSSSQHASRRNSFVQPNGPILYQPQVQSRRIKPETDGAAPVDADSLRPSPHECPLIGIHPAATANAGTYKAISRQHVKIAHNPSKRLFEAEILGRNGAFIDDEFCHYGEIKALKSGSQLQIGSVIIRFVLPEVAIGQTGAEQGLEYEDNTFTDRYSEGGKEMSFDFEDGPRDGVALEDSSDESSDNEAVQMGDRDEDGQSNGSEEDIGPDLDDLEEEEEEEEEDDEEVESAVQNGPAEDDEDGEVEQSVETDDLPQSLQKGEKKRGPGRPPKDGIMSKREQREAKKAAALAATLALQKQSAKKIVQQSNIAASTAGKNKVGRPRKHPKADTPPVTKEKRKYTKRKPKEPKDPDVKPEGDDDDASKEKKEKKPAKPPRSPSPEFNEAELTAEQLAKPNANYVTLIHEAISNSASGQMSLPQIYRAIQRRYPYFKLKCPTNGWQSSVRHNLSQHHAFQKGDKDGKGYLWSVVNGVSIEKEKKRRMTPPPGYHHPMHHQQIYTYPSMGYPPGPGMYQMPPNGHFPPQFAGQHPQHGTPYTGPQQQIAPPYPIPIPPQLSHPNGSTYSSPYAPKPPVSTPSDEQRSKDVQPPSQHSTATSLPAHPPHPPQPTAQPAQPPPSRPSQPSNPPHPPHPPQVVQESLPPLSSPQQSGPAIPDDTIRIMVESLRPTIVNLIDKQPEKPEGIKAEAIWDSIANRVLGVTTASTVNDDPLETLFMGILKKALADIGPVSGKPSNSASVSSQSEPHPSTNQIETQGNATQQPSKTIGLERVPTQVMRPSFTGRPNGTSISRPPMKTVMQRMSSGSPVNAPPHQSVRPSSVSPAAPSPAAASPASIPQPPTTNGASTLKVNVNENDQVAAQKRPLFEDADIREPKRFNEEGQYSGLKRPLEDAEEHQDFKRLSASGPPQLKA